MKIEIEVEDVEILEQYTRTDCHREWGRMSWLYPGDIIAQISGNAAADIRNEITRQQRMQKKEYERTS